MHIGGSGAAATELPYNDSVRGREVVKGGGSRMHGGASGASSIPLNPKEVGGDAKMATGSSAPLRGISPLGLVWESVE
jgi:hypothetical protein